MKIIKAMIVAVILLIATTAHSYCTIYNYSGQYTPMFKNFKVCIYSSVLNGEVRIRYGRFA